MKTPLRFAASLALTLACSAGALAADLKVGFITSLSGPVSSLGIPYEKGIRAAAAARPEVAGMRIQLLVLDDGSDPSVAARNARKLIDENKIDVLIGAAGSPAVLAMATIARESNTPMISVSNVSPKAEDATWMVTLPQPTPLMVSALVDRMKTTGVKTVGYIGFSDAWGDLVYNALQEVAGKAGIKVVSNERFARADSSVTGQVLKVVAARPDVVLTGTTGTPGALPYLALAERGYRGAIYGTHGLINPDFVRVGGAAVEGLIAPTGPVIVAEQLPAGNPMRAMAMEYRAAFEKAHGNVPGDAFSAYSYDAWLILVDAAAKVMANKIEPGTPKFRAAMREAIQNTKELVGTHGVYNFRSGSIYGSDERSRVVVRLTKGQWKLVP